MNKYNIQIPINVKTIFNLFNFQEVKNNPTNYDAWFDYLKLVESEGNLQVIRDTYERAVANIPPSNVIYICLINILFLYEN